MNIKDLTIPTQAAPSDEEIGQALMIRFIAATATGNDILEWDSLLYENKSAYLAIVRFLNQNKFHWPKL